MRQSKSVEFEVLERLLDTKAQQMPTMVLKPQTSVRFLKRESTIALQAPRPAWSAPETCVGGDWAGLSRACCHGAPLVALCRPLRPKMTGHAGARAPLTLSRVSVAPRLRSSVDIRGGAGGRAEL